MAKIKAVECVHAVDIEVTGSLFGDYYRTYCHGVGDGAGATNGEGHSINILALPLRNHTRPH